MEQKYKTALEIIRKFCEERCYIEKDVITTICDAVLEEKNGEDECGDDR